MCVGKLCRRVKASWQIGTFASLLCLTTLISISVANDGQQLGQAGLKQLWFSHSGTSGADLVDWYLDIDPNKSTTFFSISGGDYYESFSEHDIGPAGKPYGIEYGTEIANIKKGIAEKRLLAQTGKDVPVSITKYALPNSTLYTQSSNATVRAYDAETGKVKWSANVGIPTRKSRGVAANGKYVAALNGTSVYCLSAETGAVLWSKRCKSAPAAPPAMDDQDIFIPELNGRVERMSIAQEGFASIAFVSGGRGPTIARPELSPLSLCWGNYSGKLSIASHRNERAIVAVQLNTEGPIVSKPVFKDGMYFATSEDGYVYGMSESKGALVWENGTGASISQSPIVLGNSVFVINDLSQLFKFDAKSGRATTHWQTPRENVGRFAGASKEKLYSIDRWGNLNVLDQASGTNIGQASMRSVVDVLPNTKSDRLFVIDAGGTVRCLAEVSSTRPFYHSDEFVPETAKAAAEGETKPNENKSDNPFGDANPFGDDNPFGDSTDKPSEDKSGDNPFGDDASGASEDNPFGDGAAGASEDNPFGDG